jgi:membrane-bound metal-dependent hydrolase YbcI (DUF457 family)
MYVLGHAGITAWWARAVDERADLRAPMLLSLLPDVIDKPLRYVLPSLLQGNSRGLAHTVLACALVLALCLAKARPVKRALLLWSCYAGHLFLDRMWLSEGPVIALWPFLGPFPPWVPGQHTPHLLAYNLTGELIGLLLLVSLLERRPLTSACS